jgi:hypothetical protein
VKRRSVSVLSLALFLLSAGISGVWSAELLMFRRGGCPYCQTWDRVIGPAYTRSDIGQRAPLRTVDLDRGGEAGVTLARSVLFTPTFVLVQDGRELGRIEGYPGEDFFWGLLERLLARSPAS